MVRGLADFGDEPRDLGGLGGVGGDGDRLCAGAFAGEGVERGAGGGAGVGFARGDVDLGAAGLKEPRGEERMLDLLESGNRGKGRGGAGKALPGGGV